MSRSLKLKLLWSAALLVSGAGVVGLLAVEEEHRHARLTAEAHRLADQVMVQAEGLVLLAKRDGESEPLAFASRILSQGNDPRVVRVSALHSSEGPLLWKGKDLPEAGRWYSRKLVYPEDQSGFEVEVAMTPTFLFGLPTRLHQDLAAVFLTILFTVATGFLTTRLVGSAATPPPWSPESREGRQLSSALSSELVDEVREGIRRSGLAARDLIRDSHRITSAAAGSRATIAALREGLHADLTVVHQAREKVKNTRAFTESCETVLLNLILESTRMGDKGSRLAAMAQEFHGAVREMRESTREAEATMLEFELALEPRVADADQIFHASEEIFGAAESMDASIEGAKHAIVEQMKILKNLEAS